MKIGKTKLSQKILIVFLTMLLLFNFISPLVVKADDDEDGGTLAQPIMDFINYLGDGILNIMQKIFLGYSNAVYKELTDEVDSKLLGVIILDYKYAYLPNYLISPEKIFSGQVPAFDINFFQPADSYTMTIESEEDENIRILKQYVDLFTYKSTYVDIGVGDTGYSGDLTHGGYTFSRTKVKQLIYRGIARTGKGPVEKALDNIEYLSSESEYIGLLSVVKFNIGAYHTELAKRADLDLAMGDDAAVDTMKSIKEIFTYIDDHNLYGATSVTKKSSAAELQSTVSYFYNVLRNISVIGLLSVLVYIGIRIVTSSAATDKSKYKEMIKDWVVAICILFFMHYFMSFVVTVTGSISSAIAGSSSESTVTTQADTGIEYSGDKLLGDIRLRTQIEKINGKDVPLGSRMAYSLIYAILALYTIIFALMYLKRVIYMAFFTIMAPLVALTYPLDKIRDGKAQAFDMWMKEYTFNALIQPFHLIIYYVLVGSSMSLAVENPLFAVAAIGFMLPAEKILRKFFGFDKSQTSGMLGGMLSGAMLMQGMNALTKGIGKGGGKGKGKEEGKDGKKPNKQVRTANSGNNTNNLMEAIAGENSNGGAGENSNLGNGRENNSSINFAAEDPDNPGYDMSGNPIGFGNSYDDNGNEVFGKQDRMDELENAINDWEESNNMSVYEGPDDIRAMQEEYEDLAREKAMFEQENLEDDLPLDEGQSNIDEANEGTQEKEKFWNEDRKKFAGALAKTGLRYTLKGGLGAAKIAARLAAAGAMGTVGVVAGLASDDYSNVVKWGAAGLAGGNMIAGAGINRISRLPSDAYRIKETLEKERDRFEQDAFSKQKRKEIANNRADAEFMRNRQEIARYKDEFKEKYEEAMKAALDYRSYGVTDDDTIIKAMKLKTRGLGELADKKRILAAKTASQLNRKDVDAFGDRLRTNRFRASDIETMKQAIRDFNDWE